MTHRISSDLKSAGPVDRIYEMVDQMNLFDQIQSLLGSVTTAQAQEEIERLQREIAQLQAEQTKWQTLLVLKHQLGEAASATSSGNGTVGEAPTLRQAILAVMNER